MSFIRSISKQGPGLPPLDVIIFFASWLYIISSVILGYGFGIQQGKDNIADLTVFYWFNFVALPTILIIFRYIEYRKHLEVK